MPTLPRFHAHSAEHTAWIRLLIVANLAKREPGPQAPPGNLPAPTQRIGSSRQCQCLPIGTTSRKAGTASNLPMVRATHWRSHGFDGPRTLKPIQPVASFCQSPERLTQHDETKLRNSSGRASGRHCGKLPCPERDGTCASCPTRHDRTGSGHDSTACFRSATSGSGHGSRPANPDGPWCQAV